MSITLTEYLRTHRAVIRDQRDYRQSRQNVLDFTTSASVHADPDNMARAYCMQQAASWAGRAEGYRQSLKSLVATSLHMIETRMFSRAVDQYAVPATVLRERQRRRDLGEAMGHALREEDGEYFIDRVWNRAGMFPATLRRDLRDRFTELTQIEFAECECCSTVQLEEGGNWSWVEDGDGNDARWCIDCENESAKWSSAMQTYIADSAAIAYYHNFGSWHNEDPDDWVTLRWVRRQDDVYLNIEPDTGRNCAVTDEVNDEIRDEQESPDVNDYHSGIRVGHIASTYDRRKHPVLVGIELEFEFSGNRERNETVRWLKDQSEHESYFVLERDGSLECGFEAITGHTGLDVHEKNLCEMLHHQGDLYQNARTNAHSNGTHVHVSKLEMSVLHQTKLAKLIYHPDNRAFMNQLAGRRIGGDYNREVDWLQLARDAGARHRFSKDAGYSNEMARNHAQDALSDWSRYGALSVCTSTGHSVEFRMFKGSTDWSEIMAWAEFSFAAWHFAHQWGSNDMTVDKFIGFVYRPDNRADTKNLRKYLQGVMQHERALHESRRYKPAKLAPIVQVPLPLAESVSILEQLARTA